MFFNQWIAAGRRQMFNRQGLRPVTLVLLPILLLAAHLAGGWQALVVTTLAVPLGLVLAGGSGRHGQDRRQALGTRVDVLAQLDRSLSQMRRGGTMAVALVVEIDQFRQLEERHGIQAAADILRHSENRLRNVLRETDMPVRLEGAVFGVALGPARKLDLDSAMYIAGRVQRALSEPLRSGHQGVHLTASVGFALADRLTAPDGVGLLAAATLALHEAQRSGPGAIRSYSSAMRTRVQSRNNLAEEVAGALDRGDITPWFQPQIDSASGAVSGAEALARWLHPTRGMISPAEFLPALEQAGLHDRLGAVMLTASLRALRGWQDSGLIVPRIGVNFSGPELANPTLVNRILWELDAFELAADRLVIEVLETVVATQSGDAVMQNLAGLARMGCRLDLDDFGTGHASITSIRRFAIERIKIDRSFVTRIDEDPEQQKMVSAILTMAERLGLDTLAEGVETPAERDMLIGMGCGHLQGFGIARPMPLPDATAWLMAAQARAADDQVLRLPRRAQA